MSITATAPTFHERRAAALPRGVSSSLDFTIARGEGSRLFDTDGRSFLDFGSGIAVTSLGHGTPEVVDAIKDQADQFLHTCFVLGPYEGYLRVAELLNELVPLDGDARSALFSTGAEAVENAVRIARHYTGRPAIVVLESAYHGRTNLTSTMTYKYGPYRSGFGPSAAEIYRVPTRFRRGGDDDTAQVAADALADAARLIRTSIGQENVAAIIAEPIQGEGGFIVPPAGYLPGLSALAHEIGAVFIADEVQTGFARTGDWFAIEHEGVVADLVTTGKGIASGLPLAGVTGRAEIMDHVHAGGIGGTYAGNPVSCAAAIATIDVMRRIDAPGRARHIGGAFAARLDPFVDTHRIVAERRGRGAMQAVEFVDPVEGSPSAALAKEVLAEIIDRGVIALTCGTDGNVVRFLPPLTIDDADLTEGLDIIGSALESVAERH